MPPPALPVSNSRSEPLPLPPFRPAPRDENSRASQRLFEAPVVLPLTADQRRRIGQLDFFKQWYLLCHLAYISGWIVVGFVGILLLVPHVSAVDSFFIAVSSVCNCGLQTVDVGDWSTRATLLRHVLLIPGGVVITSSFQPLLRLCVLYRVRDVLRPHARDTPQEAHVRAAKHAEARRLRYTAIISAVTPLLYFAVVNGAVMALLLRLSVSRLSPFDALCLTLASFHSSIFLPMEGYAGDAAVVGLVTAACALGFTAFPVVLRTFMQCERLVLRLARCFAGLACRYFVRRGARHADPAEADASDPGDGDEAALLPSAVQPPCAALGVLDEVNAAFGEALTSAEPGAFHPFLFRSSETVFLGGAWCAITLMQAVPFWCQQWETLLHGYSRAYKLYLSLCQAAVVRFAAASFLPLTEYSNAHVAVTILAMYLPALPISTDRTYRKWREMFRTSLVRLLTSRLFWLFTGMVLVLFAEEAKLHARLSGTHFDIMTRTFFETISAYAGCGLSLSLDNSSVSFVGFTGAFSKVVVAAVILGGRHRFVDLGIDLGFGSLQSGVGAATTEDPTATATATASTTSARS